MKSKVLSSVIAVCLCTTLGASAKADTWQPSPQIKMAVAGMKGAVANVKYMRARVIWTNHLPSQYLDLMNLAHMNLAQKNDPKTPQDGIAWPPIMKSDTLWQIAGTDFYLKEESFNDEDTHPFSMTTWKKDDKIYQLNSQGGKFNSKSNPPFFVNGWIVPISKIKSYGDQFRELMENAPLRLAFNNAVADKFLQEKVNAAFKGYETIDGNKCMKIETHPSKDNLNTWWIDVNHGFVIYRSEQISKHNGMIASKSVSQASHLIKYGKTWLPQNIEIKSDMNGIVKWLRKKNPAALPPSLKNANVVVPPQIQEYTIQDVTIGDKAIPPIIWPIGTDLSFKGSNEIFIIAAVSQKELAQLNLERKTHNLSSLHEYPIGVQKPGMIGVALSDSEIKQFEKWRTGAVQ